ncbi:MAG: hypothetical protein AB7S99_05025 [Pseudodonghicola sp.]
MSTTFDRYWRIQWEISVAHEKGDVRSEIALLEEQKTLPEYRARNRVRK